MSLMISLPTFNHRETTCLIEIQHYETISHTDTLIAGTAIVDGKTLITNNTKHFDGIDELNLDNWVESKLRKVELVKEDYGRNYSTR